MAAIAFLCESGRPRPGRTKCGTDRPGKPHSAPQQRKLRCPVLIRDAPSADWLHARGVRGRGAVARAVGAAEHRDRADAAGGPGLAGRTPAGQHPLGPRLSDPYPQLPALAQEQHLREQGLLDGQDDDKPAELCEDGQRFMQLFHDEEERRKTRYRQP
jgi:hypothetical protein